MIFRSGHLRKLVAAGLGILCLIGTASAADPTAQEILEAARVNPLGNQIALDAQLRRESKSTPFTIVVDGAVRFQFKAPDQEIILQLGDDAPKLTERIGGKAAAVKPARFDEKIRGSGVTYEDLSLQFLYWKNPKLIGEDRINARPAWKIEAQAPRGASQYGVARMWIDKDSGALVRVEGYDMSGKMIRRFEVVSAQKIDGQWMLKQMRFEALNPDTRKVTDRTYLEVLGKAADS
ncbi:hypothetical protein TSACC_21585 [Terrimicrobium sacchariphilum]|jgi:hypothetical protein|uniref:Uncharacterized protein TP-0789 domain-containing protein n=1 Tax=Terrimicrobium sacchariphilum TaxID=690879 RepID=A0A146G5Z9_TERSA|nr:outer membrane lipoprotein-sorting protein [Terrimicrobium sacchariphilum]GAT33175.1 hypothetical protein TSACC_21585 [Terrimicrobium sacchariphilum]